MRTIFRRDHEEDLMRGRYAALAARSRSAGAEIGFTSSLRRRYHLLATCARPVSRKRFASGPSSALRSENLACAARVERVHPWRPSAARGRMKVIEGKAAGWPA